MITAYKRTQYLETALRSVLSQDPGSDVMQIEVVDDCSPGMEMEQLVQEIGQGRVAFYRQPQNVGIYANWNTCIQRARGVWVHILSDDDQVMPGFYQAYRHHIETYQTSVVLGQAVLIDGHGQWTGISSPLQAADGILERGLKVLSMWNRIHTPAIVVARDLYEQVGGFTTDLVYTPDWEMWTRLAAASSIAYVNRPYCLFRIHQSSETSKLSLNAETITDALAAWQIIRARLHNPNDLKAAQSAVYTALTGTSRTESRQLLQRGAYRAAIVHALWAFKFSPTLYYFVNLLQVIFRSLNALLRQKILHPAKQPQVIS